MVEDKKENFQGKMPAPSQKKIIVSVSTGTIVKIIAIIALIVILYLIVDILVAVFLAIVIAAALDPVIDKLEGKKVPRLLSSIVIYLIALGVIVLALALMIPPIATQVRDLASQLPGYFARLSGGFEQVAELSNRLGLVDSLADFLNTLSSQLGASAAGAFAAIGSFFGAAVTVITVVVVSFYLTLQEKALEKLVRSLTPRRYRSVAIELARKVQQKMGAWFRGQLLLGLVVGGITYVGLRIMGIEFALTLAIFAGILELVPIIGPIIAAIPAVFLAFLQDPILALAVLILFIAIQQFENHLLVPKIMQRAVGLNPVIVIVVILIGVKLLGVLGALVAVPLTTAIAIFLKYYFEEFYRSRTPSGEERRKAGTSFFEKIVR